nr:MAG TPA: hypothetical protein [Caudoviricetes sp.]DAS52873.1 MAG TPA: hypothetical protein [Caudoviricetes sp.]
MHKYFETTFHYIMNYTKSNFRSSILGKLIEKNLIAHQSLLFSSVPPLYSYCLY